MGLTTLLVASTGGHLKELHHLYGRLSGVDEPFRWVTFDTPQSRSLLSGQSVDFVPFVGGRDPVNVMRNALSANRILRDHQINAVVSTGSSVALPFFMLARMRGISCHYIESAARSDGPSMTGRLMSRVPGVHLYSQYVSWANGQWDYSGSVFDAFERGPSLLPTPNRLTKVVVALGTYRGYGFARLLRQLIEILPPEAEVLWQTGDTDTSGLGISSYPAIPERDFTQAMSEADVVVAHAGVGTALAALEVGKCPVLVPRRASLGEHVDDHQIQVAKELSNRSLAITIEADQLDYDGLLAATNYQVTTRAHTPPFVTVDV